MERIDPELASLFGLDEAPAGPHDLAESARRDGELRQRGEELLARLRPEADDPLDAALERMHLESLGVSLPETSGGAFTKRTPVSDRFKARAQAWLDEHGESGDATRFLRAYLADDESAMRKVVREVIAP